MNSTVLETVMSFCSKYQDSDPPAIEKPLKSSKIEDIVPEFDAKLVDLGLDDVLELIKAANYLDIKPVYDLCSAKMTLMIKGIFSY